MTICSLCVIFTYLEDVRTPTPRAGNHPQWCIVKNYPVVQGDKQYKGTKLLQFSAPSESYLTVLRGSSDTNSQTCILFWPLSGSHVIKFYTWCFQPRCYCGLTPGVYRAFLCTWGGRNWEWPQSYVCFHGGGVKMALSSLQPSLLWPGDVPPPCILETQQSLMLLPGINCDDKCEMLVFQAPLSLACLLADFLLVQQSCSFASEWVFCSSIFYIGVCLEGLMHLALATNTPASWCHASPTGWLSPLKGNPF